MAVLADLAFLPVTMDARVVGSFEPINNDMPATFILPQPVRTSMVQNTSAPSNSNHHIIATADTCFATNSADTFQVETMRENFLDINQDTE